MLGIKLSAGIGHDSSNCLREVINLVQHNRFRILLSDIHLHTAMMKQTLVNVYIGPELLGSGMIEEIKEEFIKIQGEYYLRETCTFTYSK